MAVLWIVSFLETIPNYTPVQLYGGLRERLDIGEQPCSRRRRGVARRRWVGRGSADSRHSNCPIRGALATAFASRAAARGNSKWRTGFGWVELWSWRPWRQGTLIGQPRRSGRLWRKVSTCFSGQAAGAQAFRIWLARVAGRPRQARR